MVAENSRNIYRVEKNANYVVMNRTVLSDDRLSWKAKGIMAYMLSMPDDWTFYLSELMNHSTDGEKSFRNGFKELKDSGYVKRKPVYEDNKISHWETIVHEIPQTQASPVLAQNLQVGNVQVENLQVENDNLLSTDSLPSTDVKPSTEYIVEIVNYLNNVSGKNYRSSTYKTKKEIEKRWKEGFRLDDFKKVIDIKNAEWQNDPKMSKFIRPETLFGNKFDGYLNQNDGTPPDDDNHDYGF